MVSKIPFGKVATYGQVAEAVGRDPSREGLVISQALKYAPDEIPYHRVVNKEGNVATGYPGGQDAQREKLIKEGVEFVGFYRVDLKKTRHYFD
jgi:methylated-DNA-protein-cysteine methyltransferase-like protein